MTRELHEYLLAIVAGLPGDWRVSSFQRHAMGWIARIGLVDGEQFELVSDRFYIDVGKLVGGKSQPIYPPEGQRISITIDQIIALILANQP